MLVERLFVTDVATHGKQRQITGGIMEKQIYLDHAATTQPAPEVVQQMLPWLSGRYGNPSARYQLGQEAGRCIAEARKQVAALIGADEEEVYFTSGGTESDNWVLRGCLSGRPDGKRHMITTGIEHHAILNTCARLEREGAKVSYVMPDSEGRVDVRDIEREIREDTALISVMYANNEIGTLQPIREIGLLAAEYGIPFHTDAVQAVGHVPVDVKTLGITWLSASAHKFYGPKGCGFLYMRKGHELPSMLCGGAQERGLRAGTENVAGIAGMGAAARVCMAHMAGDQETVRRQRDYLIRGVESAIPGARLNGHRRIRLPNNVNFSFQGLEGAALLLLLDQDGICVSSGAACNASSEKGSHVLAAIGVPEEYQRGTVRMTLGPETAREDLDYVIGRLKEHVFQLREMKSS